MTLMNTADEMTFNLNKIIHECAKINKFCLGSAITKYAQNSYGNEFWQ